MVSWYFCSVNTFLFTFKNILPDLRSLSSQRPARSELWLRLTSRFGNPPSVESGPSPLFAYVLRDIDIRVARKCLKCLALNGTLLKLSRHCHVFENVTRTWKG